MTPEEARAILDTLENHGSITREKENEAWVQMHVQLATVHGEHSQQICEASQRLRSSTEPDHVAQAQLEMLEEELTEKAWQQLRELRAKGIEGEELWRNLAPQR